MSYRCQICNAWVPHGIPLQRKVLYRENGEIEREIPVCTTCLEDLRKIPLPVLDRYWKRGVKRAVKRARVEAREQRPNQRRNSPGNSRN